MKFDALTIFLILLFGLLVCSFLGGGCSLGHRFSYEGFDNNIAQQTGVVGAESELCTSDTCTADTTNEYDNYNHYAGGSTTLTNGAIFYGPNGGKVVVVIAGNGKQYLQITPPNSTEPILFTWKTSSTTTTITTFYGPNGATATVVKTSDGQRGIKVTNSDGTTTIYTANQYVNPPSTLTPNSSSNMYPSTTYPPTTYPPTTYPPTTYPPTTYPPTTYSDVNIGSVTTPAGNTVYYAAGEKDTVNNNDNTYSNYLPPGIPANQIPPGQEDLYILKSEVVPPVCPACPSNIVTREKPCPACPACARCPEPAFDCKKVPNYNNNVDQDMSGWYGDANQSQNQNYNQNQSYNQGQSQSQSSWPQNSSTLPVPVLSDFSTFGM